MGEREQLLSLFAAMLRVERNRAREACAMALDAEAGAEPSNTRADIVYTCAVRCRALMEPPPGMERELPLEPDVTASANAGSAGATHATGEPEGVS